MILVLTCNQITANKMKELIKYQNKVNIVCNHLFNKDSINLPQTIEGCKERLNYLKNNYGVII